jgi:hypothetical protein
MAAGRKTGGRQAGTPNKITKELKTMILEALDGVGGVEYLQEQARESPNAFLSLVGKVLPLQVGGVDGAPIRQAIEVMIVDPKA